MGKQNIFSNETIIEELCLVKGKHSDNHSEDIQYLCTLTASMISVKAIFPAIFYLVGLFVFT